MNTVQIIAVVAVLVVAAAIFVVIIRSDSSRVRRGEADAAATGEDVKKSPPLGIVYFVVGVGFVIAGIVTLIPH